MKEDLFRVFLESEGLTANGVNSRMAKVRKVEAILGQDLDTLVANDKKMAHALKDLQAFDSKEHAPYQNALRKYYKFKNGKEFPKLRDFK